MNRKLELVVWPKLRKKIEFGQTLDCLSGVLQDYCSGLRIDQSEDEDTYTIEAVWKDVERMDQMIRSKEFLILSGAIAALCDRIDIWLDGELVGTDISQLPSLTKNKY